MQQVANIAINHGRRMTFVGTSMNENARMSRKLGYLDIPDNLMVSVEQALKMKPNEVVLMCTGSQGEPSSILGRLSTGTNRQFDLQAGDTVVLSSHPIPGNEESVHRAINRLFRRGANVIYDAIAPVHVSGHASQEEEKLLINLVKPKHFIPIHGELRHLHQHADLARELGIPADRVATVENGHSIEFENGTCSWMALVWGILDLAWCGNVKLWHAMVLCWSTWRSTATPASFGMSQRSSRAALSSSAMRMS
jgi:ribonuclease J